MAWFPLNLRCSAPIIMVSTLLAALGSAIGHHLFYDNLDGEPVLDSDPLSSIASFYSISDQQFNVSIGTLFALLVKSLLGITVSTVFDQFAWKAIKGRMRSIGIIDDLFSTLKNGFMVLDYVLWRHYPFSMLLACIAWLLPVTTVITPATLSVHMASFSNTTLMRVPRVDFRQFKFATLMDYANSPQFMYETSKPEVQRILVNTAVQGNIMPIKPPSINSSWTLEFYGPALKCEHVDDDTHRAITQNVQSAILNTSTFGVDDRKDLARVAYTFGYLAWPADTSSTNKTLPFEKHNVDSTYSLRINKGNPAGAPETDERSTNPISMFIATFPHMAEQGDRTENELNGTTLDAVILNCRLYNASYEANFTYVNGQQDVRIPHIQFSNEAIPVGMSQTMNIENPSTKDLDQMERYSYVSIIDELGDFLSGEIHQKTTRKLDSLKANGNEINWGANETVIELDNTNAMLTPLARTKELNFLYAAMSSNNQWNNSKNGMPASQPASTALSLSDALEKMFQNITVSMMSSNRFQPNYTTSPMPDVNVTMTAYHNVYSYSQRILWTAYGIALGVSMVNVVLGVIIYFFNHGSYSTKFSTILRTTRIANISTVFNAEDVKGLNPLPDHINDADISFKDGRDQGQSPGKAVFNVEELEMPLTPQTPESARLLKSPELYEEVGLGLNQRLGPSGWFNGGARRDIRYHEVNQ